MKWLWVAILSSISALAMASIVVGATGDVMLDTANPVVLVIAPNGGTYHTGDTAQVQWSAADTHPVTAPITVEWRTSDAAGWSSVSSSESNDGAFPWTIPTAYTEQARVRITMTDAFGNTGSNQTDVFTILPGYNAFATLNTTLDTANPAIHLTCPTTDSVFVRGDPLPIRWSTTETHPVADSCAALDWRREPMAPWQGIATGQTDDGAYDWVTPADSTSRAVVRVAITDAFGNLGEGMSPRFTIVQPHADFTADITSGHVPLTVQFTDTSIGQVGSWAWDFDGDGVIDSNDPNPTWTYLFPWQHNVSLTVTFADAVRQAVRREFGRESDSEVREGFIQATLDPLHTLSVPSGYATIQAAIDAASDGDYIIVDDGTYYENLQIVGKEITLASRYFVDGDTTHVDETIIDGSATRNRSEASVIAIKPGANPGLSSHVVGFTITHGLGRTISQSIGDTTVEKVVGGGLYIEHGNPVFTRNKVVENDATDEGGGSYALYSNPNFGGNLIGRPIVNPGVNLFRGNNADVGRDLYIVGDALRDEVAAENCDFSVFCRADTTLTAYWSTSNTPVNYSGGRGESNAISHDIWVATDGNDSGNSGLTADSPFQTIDHALSLAYGSVEHPVTIHIGAGTYAPYTTGERFPLQMVSHVSLTGAGKEETFLDAGASADTPNRVITLDHVTGCEIRNLTLYGGVVTAGKGMNGAGIAGFDASASLVNVGAFDLNAAGNGGAGYFYNSTIDCDSLSLTGITALGNGGGISSYQSAIRLDHSTFDQNSAHYGGGFHALSSRVALSDCQFEDNTTSGTQRRGGGISLDTCDSVRVERTTIKANQADFGAGIYLQGCTNLLFLNNRIVNNLQSLTQYSSGGGGLYWNSACTGTFANNLIANNQAFQGGAGMGQSLLTFLNNTVANNRATYKGGAFYLNSCSPVYQNSILWGNTAASGGNQFYLQSNSSDPAISFSDIQGGTAAFGLSTGTYTGAYTNNLNANPLFTAPSTGMGNTYDALTADWSLQATSPCRDAGNPTADTSLLPTDLLGNPRLQNAIIDQGACEFQIVITPDAPHNLRIEVAGTNLVLSWDAVPSASSYKVFADTDAAGTFTQEVTSTGTVTESEGRTSWTMALPTEARQFFVVRASTESPARSTMSQNAK
jgi:PKD repeat protein